MARSMVLVQHLCRADADAPATSGPGEAWRVASPGGEGVGVNAAVLGLRRTDSLLLGRFCRLIVDRSAGVQPGQIVSSFPCPFEPPDSLLAAWFVVCISFGWRC